MVDQRIYKPNSKTIDRAVNLLQQGKLVSFPTETVYGLGADATNNIAVAKIYEAKNRPNFNPLIVHVHDFQNAVKLVKMNSIAEKLAAKFWPGPFTMVLPVQQNSKLSDLIMAGLDTVAIRVPENKIAQSLLEHFNRPIAAPSANKSGKISPTNAVHVAAEFDNELELIIDGGQCKKGIESTIVQVTHDQVILLRPGNITAEEIEIYLGQTVISSESDSSAPTSPGQLKSHYAPNTKIRLNAIYPNENEGLLAFGPQDKKPSKHYLNLSATGNLTEAAANLFSMLRILDDMKLSSIAIQPIPTTGLGIAINDRLKRAAAPKEE